MTDDATSNGTTHGRSGLGEETRLALRNGTSVLGWVSVLLGWRGGGRVLAGLLSRSGRWASSGAARRASRLLLDCVHCGLLATH